MYDILRMLYIDVHWMYIVEELGCICGSGKSGKGGKRKEGEGQKYRQIVTVQIILIIVDKLVSIVDAKEIRQKMHTKNKNKSTLFPVHIHAQKKIIDAIAAANMGNTEHETSKQKSPT